MRRLIPCLAAAGLLALAGCGAPAAAPQAPPASSVARSTAAKPSPSEEAAAQPSGLVSTTQNTAGDPNGTPVTVAYASQGVANWPFFAAAAAGLYAREHLKVTMIQMAPNVTITALSKGELDFTNSPGNAIEGALRGLPFKVVLSSWDESPWTIVGKPEIASVKDLKGRTVGTNQAGSTPYLYLQAALKRDGLAISDIKVVSSPGTQDTYRLLLSGQLDAAVLSPPTDAQAVDKGFREVAFIGDTLHQPYIGLGADTSYLSQHRPEAVRLIRALMDANGWLKGHPDQAANLIEQNLSVPPNIAKQLTQRMLPLLSQAGELAPAGLQEAISIQSELTKTNISVKPEDLVDWGPLHEALGKP
ncbi:MAG TPA: ABC transporter substrate-binding protein [Chloroflexota bacterium]|nr:ABC transporter substrate-binding protein [Chloroflexota bacterium]